MDLCTEAIQEVVHPTAAFTPQHDPQDLGADHAPSWDDSLLNPKNRIDSLDLPQMPLWRIDGSTGLGTQYYALPLFLSAVPPTRMDVFIPADQPRVIQQQLDLDVAFHVKDAVRLSRLAITRHIIRTLHLWVATEFKDLAAFKDFYQDVPFGTRLVFENLSLDIRNIQVRVGLNHNLERQLTSVSGLKHLWGPDFVFPDVIDFYEIQVIGILHDSVCLVRIRGELFIFKALTSGPKYLYHELKVLCTLTPHSHVIARPVHVVMKTCKFGGKKAIVGFTTFFHSKGSLRDHLPQLRIHGQLKSSDQFKWSVQLATALDHLRVTSQTYYPDLRLDNIVLSENSDIVMVDFEQRGVWCEFAAPEVNAIEYIRLIATDEDMSDEIHEKYNGILRRLNPHFEELLTEKYTNATNGYNVTWLALSAREQEAAEVYMLGRVLWCLFEGVSGPQKAAVWQSYRWESDLEFPEFQRTPPALRLLIDRCTRGRRDTLSGIITRQGSRLVLRDRDLQDQGPEDVKNAARRFWVSELQVAEDFLAMREERKAKGEWDENFYSRPSIREALAALKTLQSQHQ
ncbi:uncharacterized protein BCR38DRAFT_338772 [Pseudomassariella vexata]|uniref:Protein kinase domain-containing protein n=1 Tax=Pseudomassariella vexata TaxID=1141098 RepID=A0A1Y2E2U2_9PEZI|nr:uncharacterized protein BCR38DRAFT_338772 [Pseudomassariella vexata]ORY65863.1 hypothetical protein BCR38DRAFT_338772 [Pseudomassariella vexata]